jgi:hypothetical protein
MYQKFYFRPVIQWLNYLYYHHILDPEVSELLVSWTLSIAQYSKK